jgi:hypothetical protein
MNAAASGVSPRFKRSDYAPFFLGTKVTTECFERRWRFLAAARIALTSKSYLAASFSRTRRLHRQWGPVNITYLPIVRPVSRSLDIQNHGSIISNICGDMLGSTSDAAEPAGPMIVLTLASSVE